MQVENKQCCLVYFAIYFGWKSDLDHTRSDEYENLRLRFLYEISDGIIWEMNVISHINGYDFSSDFVCDSQIDDVRNHISD